VAVRHLVGPAGNDPWLTVLGDLAATSSPMTVQVLAERHLPLLSDVDGSLRPNALMAAAQ
jgi:hypothetical protein